MMEPEEEDRRGSSGQPGREHRVSERRPRHDSDGNGARAEERGRETRPFRASSLGGSRGRVGKRVSDDAPEEGGDVGEGSGGEGSGAGEEEHDEAEMLPVGWGRTASKGHSVRARLAFTSSAPPAAVESPIKQDVASPSAAARSPADDALSLGRPGGKSSEASGVLRRSAGEMGGREAGGEEDTDDEWGGFEPRSSLGKSDGALGTGETSDGGGVFRLELQPLQSDTEDADGAGGVGGARGDAACIEFLQEHTCNQMIPTSGKVVVLDTRLSIKAAFHALIENNLNSAPLWDAASRTYVGVITVTDFIAILQHFHGDSSLKMSTPELEKYRISEWRQILEGQIPERLIHAEPSDSIYDAARTLLTHRIHRLPVIDMDAHPVLLHVITHFSVFSFLTNNIVMREDLANASIAELNIGTFTNVVTVLQGTKLIVLLNMLVERKISAVPVVDETGVVVGLYSKGDAVQLTRHKQILRTLDEPAAGFQREVHTCAKHDTLITVVNDMRVHRTRLVVCVDSQGRVEGVISISDLLRFLLAL